MPDKTASRLPGLIKDMAIAVVTADGRLMRSTPGRDSDLFWAVRGGKDNFAVVTATEFGLFEVPRLPPAGLVRQPLRLVTHLRRAMRVMPCC